VVKVIDEGYIRKYLLIFIGEPRREKVMFDGEASICDV
jgi:hypothetical protein